MARQDDQIQDDQRKGKKSGNRRPESQTTMVSKRLSFLLRHGAEKAGVKMYPGGWVLVSDAMEWRDVRKLNATFEQIVELTLNNEKKRYQIVPAKLIIKDDENVDTANAEQPPVTELAALDEDYPSDASKHLIRAVQGHSIKSVEASDLLTPIQLDDIPGKVPEYVVHGTNEKAWLQIQTSGLLSPMTRQHVHFAVAPKSSGPEKVISGMRSDRKILIWVNVKDSLADGSLWWQSANNVILSAGTDGGIPTKYWDRVEKRDAKGEVEVVWSNTQTSTA